MYKRILNLPFILICIIAFCIIGIKDMHADENFIKITFPNGKIIKTEIADNDQKRAYGLMFRKNLPYEAGMLFIFDEEDFHSFWMKNTLIPLDILWLDKDMRILYYFANVPPCKSDPCQSYKPLFKAKYVLEVNSGFIKKENLKLGDRLQTATVR